MSSFRVTTNWKRTADFKYDTFNRDHQITFSGNQILNNSAAVDYYGNDNMANPEELIASAVSTCHMLTFLALASKTGFVVESYEDDAVAILDKNAEGRTAVTDIKLHPKITFSGTTPDETKLREMHNKAHRNCFIAQSVRAQVEVVF